MNASRKKGLGRGLSALFGDSTPEEKTKNINQSTMVAIADLTRNPYQPRQNFKEDKLEEKNYDDDFQSEGKKHRLLWFCDDDEFA